jgi:hypothetical protein
MSRRDGEDRTSLVALQPREASIFACLTETVVAPQPLLPPVRETDAVRFFDFWLERSPRVNRVALRLLLYAAELAPPLLGFRGRMRRLAPADRAKYLHAVERARWPQLRQLAKLVKGIAFLSYYGDDDIMRTLGYDPDANVRRGRELRLLEGRP